MNAYYPYTLLKFAFLGAFALLLVGCGKGEFHCRITKAIDYETKAPIETSTIIEFTVRPTTSTNIYLAGDVFGMSHMGPLNTTTGNRVAPFVVISKLDGKFDGMYIFHRGGALVDGFCEKTSIF